MPELIVLGTAASVPDAEHDTVGLVLRGPGWAVLIECGGSPLHRLARLGIDPSQIEAAILTHRHADHIYGLPMLVQGLWLSGRRRPLRIYGPAETMDVAQRLVALFELEQQDDPLPVQWHAVTRREGRPVLQVDGVQIRSSPAHHGGVQTLALRFDNTATGRSIVYSSDTQPSPSVARLAAGADLLIHEATGELPVHSSPAEAAELARQAGVVRLALIHYPVLGVNLESWQRSAAIFPGPVSLARDGDVYDL